MAKDRARDPKRVPSLGISDPISHVKVHHGASGLAQAIGKRKMDSEHQTDEHRQAIAKAADRETDFNNMVDRSIGKTPVVKINSGN